MFYTLVKRTELQTILDVNEKFLIFVAALGHDLNHSITFYSLHSSSE